MKLLSTMALNMRAPSISEPEPKEQSPVDIDVSDLAYTKPLPEYMVNVQSLPNQESVKGCNLAGFPIYLGNERWIVYLNKLLRHAKGNSWGHRELLHKIEGLSIFPPGMQEGVREYIESVEMGTFRKTTDNVIIHGKSPEVTRKLIHLIEWLCRHFYQPTKGDPMAFVYSLCLIHY